ncbi:MAG: hypothetical protein FJ044_01080, partial [Candidatus Cloacimonetes bacterium]|nr:hypothetical protein [Candidatus Cloacimonadota bacterium]
MSQVVILKTTPQTILQDYARLMHLAEYEKNLSKDTDLLLKLNLSWTKFFPACSTPPWQLEGVVKTLLDDGFDKNRIFPVENKTVVTNPWQGAKENKWLPILEKYGLKFTALPEVEWVKYDFKSDLLVLNKIFPEGIYIPKMFIGKQVLHLPTVKCVHPDTEIFLSDGSLIKIKELVKNVQKKRGVIVTSDKDRVSESNHNLPTLNIEGKITRGKAYQFWETPAPQYGVKIKTRTGREVIVSEEHPFLTPKGWEKAKSLHPNNRIAIPRRISIKGESQLLPELRQPKPNDLNLDKINFHNGRKFSASVQKKFLEEYFDGKEIKKTAAVYGMSGAAYKSIFKRYNIPHRSQRNWLVKTPRKTSPEFWRWVGYFTAEGHLDGDDYFIFVNSDPDIQKDYVSLGRRLFNIDIEFKRGKDAQFRSVQLREFFQKLGWQVPLLAGNKRAPRLLFKCPQEEIAAFLQGYFEGDGCMVERTIGNKLIMYLYATTKSHQLARDLLYLLLRLGVVAFKRKTRKH